MCHNIFFDFAAKCLMSPEDRCQTEEARRDQANSPLWFEARTGCLTSSHFGEIMKRKPARPPDCLLKTIMQYDVCSFNSAHTYRKYYSYMKEEHTHITVMRTGLIVHEDLSFLATIPDGIVQCTHCQPSQGLLEVKCPSVHRKMTHRHKRVKTSHSTVKL